MPSPARTAILIVSGKQQLRRLIRERLSENDFSFTEALDTCEAGARLHDAPPKIVIIEACYEVEMLEVIKERKLAGGVITVVVTPSEQELWGKADFYTTEQNLLLEGAAYIADIIAAA